MDLRDLAGDPAVVFLRGAWTEDGTYTAKLCFYETPFTMTLTLKFSGEELHFNAESNVGFGATKGPQLVGKAE